MHKPRFMPPRERPCIPFELPDTTGPDEGEPGDDTEEFEPMPPGVKG